MSGDNGKKALVGKPEDLEAALAANPDVTVAQVIGDADQTLLQKKRDEEGQQQAQPR